MNMSLLACIVLTFCLLYQFNNKQWSYQSPCFLRQSHLCDGFRSSSVQGQKKENESFLLLSPNRYHLPPLRLDYFKRHDLTAVLVVRLFSGDTLHFDRIDLDQWLTYMSYAGVNHFYVYDNCLREVECQRDLALRPDITYIQWSHSDYMTSQTPAYNHHLQAHFPHSAFETIMDIDEFPFMPLDPMPGFLQRHVVRRNDSQFLVRTLFFGGAPNKASSPWRVNRYTHRRIQAERESRTKPIYKPDSVDYRGSTNLHEMRMKYTISSQRKQSSDVAIAIAAEITHSDDPTVSQYDKYMGYDMAEDPTVLRLNHYWCERFSERPPVEDISIQAITTRIDQWIVQKKKGNNHVKV